MKPSLLFFFILFSKCAFCQLDSIEVNNFIKIARPEEEKFISFLENDQIDSGLSKISTQAILKFGTPELRIELHHLYMLFLKYGQPKCNYEFNSSVQRPYRVDRMSGFGHTVRGTIEEKAAYYFQNPKGEIIYSFTLYYSNYENFGIIKFFNVYDNKKHEKDDILISNLSSRKQNH